MDSVLTINNEEVAKKWIPVMRKHEQADCPLTHHFAPGIYAREMQVPKGTIIVGFRHVVSSMNVILSGKMSMILPDGTFGIVTPPMIFPSGPGRKIIYAHEDSAFMNIFATEETNIETLENTLVDRSDDWTPEEIEYLEGLKTLKEV